jgi:hypothetical protein
MKIQLEFHSVKIHRLVSMLLVTLFLSISLLQLVHAHAPFVSKEDIGSKNLLSAVEKCEICDFTIHKQSKYIPIDSFQNVIIVWENEVNDNCEAYISNYEFSLQGYTNKGPPLKYS